MAKGKGGFVRLFKYFVQAFNSGMQDAAQSTLQTPVSRPAARAGAFDGLVRPDRKADILLAAEKLFAQRGYHAVTIRQIAEEAGVPLALVGYYYGPKQALFQAIFAHWNSTIEERVNALRAVPLDADNPRTLPAIIEAFIGPVLRLRGSSEGEYYALLVARELYHATDEADQVLRAFFDPLAHAFIDALHLALPGSTRGQVAWVYQFALGALLHHISDGRVERLSKGENMPNDPMAAVLLANFIVGGIRAALAAEPAPGSSPVSVVVSSTSHPKTRRPKL